MFCKTCGTLLTPKKTEYGRWMSCPNGHSQPTLNKESRINTEKSEARRIEVSDGENILAVYDHICKKCGHNKCELIEIAPLYGDEDAMIRMKCGKCGFTEQLEGKVK